MAATDADGEASEASAFAASILPAAASGLSVTAGCCSAVADGSALPEAVFGLAAGAVPACELAGALSCVAFGATGVVAAAATAVTSGVAAEAIWVDVAESAGVPLAAAWPAIFVAAAVAAVVAVAVSDAVVAAESICADDVAVTVVPD
jgi:hypothetical protein